MHSRLLISLFILVIHCRQFIRGDPTQNRVIKDLLAPESTSASLSCEPLLIDDSCQSAAWFKDGQPLGTSSVDRNLVLRFSTTVSVPDDVPQIGLLHLVGLRKGDDGRFWCICNGISGQVVRVRIVYLDNWFRTPPQVLHTGIGQSVVLKCRHPAGFPAPSVRWEKDGQLIRQDERYRLISATDLMLIWPTEEQSGEYTCIAWNVMGERRLHHRLFVVKSAMGKGDSSSPPISQSADAFCVVGIASYFLSAVILFLLILDLSWNVRPVLSRLRCRFSRPFYRYPRANLDHLPPTSGRALIAYEIPPPPYSIVSGHFNRGRPVSVI